MKTIDLEPPPSGLNLHDILFILCKHKWKVVLCVVAGLAAAVGFCFVNPPLYQSDAKLLVRYVVERSAVDPVEGSNGGASKLSDSAINSEIETLTSWDLFEQVAEAVGVERLLPMSKGSATKIEAARAVGLGLTVTGQKGSSVILVSYKNSDPQLAVLVLDALLKSYFTKHLEIHRSKATFDLVSQQNELLRAGLTKMEDELKKKKADAGIISVTNTAEAISAEEASTEQEIDAAQTALARQRALVAELERSFGSSNPDPAIPSKTTKREAAPPITTREQANTPRLEAEEPRASAEDLENYQAYLYEIAVLRKKGIELHASYNPEALPVKVNQADIAALDNKRHALERKYPDLLGKVASSAPAQGQPAFSLERAKLASLEAGMLILDTRLHNVQERAKAFAQIAPDIEELERDKQLQETNYTSSRAKLESASVDEALDPSKIPNISTVQRPSPAMRVAGTRQKIMLGLAGGGIGLGIVLALLSELVLDQTIKRPMELERQLRIPLLISIPQVPLPRSSPLPALNGKSGKDDTTLSDPNGDKPTVAPWEAAHFLRSYSVAIRDRLSYFFELNNLTHKPKLVAVTGFSKKCGASTIAAGVAAALSETGDGKVLLVDMNVGRGEVHPFFRGEPVSSLNAALQREGEITSATDNLYVAAGLDAAQDAAPVGFKRFHDLLPRFEASVFDYIVFDMPPVSQMSPTSAMARLMDKVLFVVESEKSNRDMVKRAYADLCGTRSNVAVVLNKVRSYAPRWIEGEM